KHYNKTNRYKPVVTGSTTVSDTTTAPPSETYNAASADDAFYSGACGYQVNDVQSWQVAVYTTSTVNYYTYYKVDATGNYVLDAAGAKIPLGTTQVSSGWVWQQNADGSYVKDAAGNLIAMGYSNSTLDHTATVSVVDHYETHYSYTRVNWAKAADGFMWTEAGTEPEKVADKMTQTGSQVTSSPVGTKAAGMAQATANHVANATASVGVTLGTQNSAQVAVSNGTQALTQLSTGTGNYSTVFTGTSGNETIFKSSSTLPVAPSIKVSGAAVSSAAVVPAVAGLVPTPGTVAENTEDKVSLQANLVAQFKGLGVQNAETFAALALSKLTPQEIASALAGSNEGTEALMGALGNAYQTLLGSTYQKSILGSILDLAKAGSAFEAVKQALLGGEAKAADAKLSAQKSQDARYAQVSRDENGNIVEALGKNGEVYKFTYDASGKTETSLVGGTLTVKHFGNNNLLLSENGGGTSKTFDYTIDGQGRVTSTEVKVHAADGTRTLKYDAAGKLLTKEQDGVTQTYSYSGNKIEVAARNAQGVEIVKKVYEGGRLVEKIDPSTHTQYSYMTDASGNVLGVTMKVTDKDGQTSFFKFNASGEMTGKAANGSNRFVKTEESTAQEAMAFESAKSLFSDKRMVGEKLDQTQMQIQPVQVPQQRH
ncbi:MAG: hypothetical protein HGA76_11765, partial [Candidatus Firestonebacteria bacterium]|nr:hypothetical protein [Candidatus Firestonebacteria bacterium]